MSSICLPSVLADLYCAHSQLDHDSAAKALDSPPRGCVQAWMTAGQEVIAIYTYARGKHWWKKKSDILTRTIQRCSCKCHVCTDANHILRRLRSTFCRRNRGRICIGNYWGGRCTRLHFCMASKRNDPLVHNANLGKKINKNRR